MSAPLLTLGQPVVVSPSGAAPYAARFAQHTGVPGMVYVRGSQGLHAVRAEDVTPRVLGLGDDKAERHGAWAR